VDSRKVHVAYQLHRPFSPESCAWEGEQTIKRLRQFKEEGWVVRLVDDPSELVLGIEPSRKLITPFPLHVLKELNAEDLVS
jgi:hypothetical protein